MRALLRRQRAVAIVVRAVADLGAVVLDVAMARVPVRRIVVQVAFRLVIIAQGKLAEGQVACGVVKLEQRVLLDGLGCRYRGR